MTTRNTIAGLLAITLLATACGATAGSTDTTAVAADPTTTTVAIDPDQVVLMVEDSGGFVPIEFALSNGPRYVLTADGRLIYQGPMIEIFPGPLWPNYQVRQLTESDMDLVMDAIAATAIDQVTDETDTTGSAVIADAANTVIRYFDDAGEHRYSVYALGFEGVEFPEQVDRLAGLVRTLDALAGEGVSEEFVPETVQVIAAPAEPTGDEFEQVVDWPLDTDPATFEELEQPSQYRCATFTGDEATALLATFREANQSTLFQAEGTTWKVYPRPLLPGEEACTSNLGA